MKLEVTYAERSCQLRLHSHFQYRNNAATVRRFVAMSEHYHDENDLKLMREMRKLAPDDFNAWLG
jgi:hypothetical protein